MGPELRKRILTRYPEWHRQPLTLNLHEMEEPLMVARWFFDIYNLPDIRACLRFWMEEVVNSDAHADHLVTSGHLEKLVEAAWVWKEQNPLPQEEENLHVLPLFNRIENHLPCRIIVRQTGRSAVSGIGKDLVNISVRGNVLRLYPVVAEGNHPWPDPLVIECESLQSIFSSAGFITSEGTMETERIRLDQEGKASFSLALKAMLVETVMHGTGKIDLSGSCASMGLHTYGAGAFEAPALEARTASLRICGSGAVVFQATQRIEGLISGTSVVYYLGQPEAIEVTVAPGGALLPVNSGRS